jgi:hypothetical protein
METEISFKEPPAGIVPNYKEMLSWVSPLKTPISSFRVFVLYIWLRRFWPVCVIFMQCEL